MELYNEILAKILENQEMVITFPDLDAKLEKMFESECYKALEKIKAIISDGRMRDTECFMEIENIICTFEDLGSDGGFRHDF